MIRDPIAGRIKQIITDELGHPLATGLVQEDTSLFGKGVGLNSLDAVTLVVSLEDEFQVCFNDDEIAESVRTFGALVRAVHAKLAHNRGRNGA